MRKLSGRFAEPALIDQIQDIRLMERFWHQLHATRRGP
jgi:hypothetical protein